jgi:hypothetical protein
MSAKDPRLRETLQTPLLEEPAPLLRRIETVHDAGGEVNEDLVHAEPLAAWVVDGATPLGSQRVFAEGASDAAHFVQRFDAELKRLVHEPWNLSEVVEAALTAVLRGLFARVPPDLDPAELPTATIALMRVAARRLEIFLLGDCRVLVRNRQGFFLDVEDCRQKVLDDKAIEVLRQHLDRGATFEEGRDAITELLRANRRLSNRPGGYWVLGDAPEAARRGFSFTIEAPPGGLQVLMMTDGFASVLDYGPIKEPRELLDAVQRQGLQPILRHLREIESADPQCRRHPRLKPSDDATAIYFED